MGLEKNQKEPRQHAWVSKNNMLNKCLVSTYYEQGTVLGARNSVVTRTGFASKAGNIEKYLGSQRAWA